MKANNQRKMQFIKCGTQMQPTVLDLTISEFAK